MQFLAPILLALAASSTAFPLLGINEPACSHPATTASSYSSENSTAPALLVREAEATQVCPLWKRMTFACKPTTMDYKRSPKVCAMWKE